MNLVKAFQNATCPNDVLTAASVFFDQDEANPLRVHTLEDLDRCIDRVRSQLATRAMLDADEARLSRTFSYLLIAWIRARQLS